MNDYLEDVDFDYSTDFYNSKHVNIAGAKKATSFIAAYLKDNYGLQSQLTDGQKQSWTDACSAWEMEEKDLLSQWEKYKKEK